MFHEYMHIFCAETEVDGEHFIDVYGTGLTFDDDDVIDFGYRFWSEFVAQYYALKHTESRKPPFAAVQDFIFDCMVDVEVGNTGAGPNYAQACARLMTCADFDDILVRLKSEQDFFFNDSVPHGENARRLFLRCLSMLQGHLKNEKPWRIDMKYIDELGELFGSFKFANKLFLMQAD
jgi:hypothetical protein